ncbi:protein pxr1-like [Willisornis vidua]|uniref:Protein pxr1-like n=1 Tax=Willisornis vidua TaxID=1566151 RepID=A0ABQ9DFG5_9PASS|nr:protein pxr1-like [Willisornis vidua]
MLAGSRTDLQLAKTVPISDGGSTLEITDLTNKKPLQWQPKRGVKIHGRNSTADMKISEEGGEEVLQILHQPVVKVVVRLSVFLQPMVVHSRAEIHLQCMEDPMLQPKGGCDPWEDWSRLLTGPVDPWKEKPL